MRLLTTPAILAALLIGCGPEEKPYEPKPAYSGKAPTIPQPPTLENKAKMDGDAFTVWGAIHDLHSNVHEKDFEGKDVAFVGYVVKINWQDACKDPMTREEGDHCVPKCAVHKVGKEDEAGCEAPIPTYWIADSKDEQDWKKHAIPVMGWASNFAQMYTQIDKRKTDDEYKHMDEFYGVELPTPLPGVGAKVKVKGRYAFTATVGTKGASSNPRTGIITWKSQEWLEPPAEETKLPGMD